MSLLDPVEEIEKRTEFHFPINGDWLKEIGFKEVIPRSYVLNAYNRKWFMRLHSATHNVWQLEYHKLTDERNYITSTLVETRKQLLKFLLT